LKKIKKKKAIANRGFALQYCFNTLGDAFLFIGGLSVVSSQILNNFVTKDLAKQGFAIF